MRQVVMASRRRASRSLSRRGLGPGRMASPSACTSASMSASIRANESVRCAARSLVCSSRSAAARASKPGRSRRLSRRPQLRQFLRQTGERGGGARPSAAASGACYRRRSASLQRTPKAPSWTASRMRSAVRRLTPNSVSISSSVMPPRRPCIRIASFTIFVSPS